MKSRVQVEELNIIICKLTELYGMWAKKNGMSYNSMMTLYALNQLGECSQKEICEGWLIPKQTVNTILKDFIEKGYVTLKINENDKRGKIISFTDKGRDYAYSKLKGLYEIEERTMDCLGVKELDKLIKINKKYLDVFNKEVNNE